MTVSFFQDETPAKKKSLLKKLTEAIKFRKKARTKEQQRILDIINNSPLKKSLDSVNSSLTGLDSTSVLRDSSLKELHTAIQELREILKTRTDNGETSADDSNPAGPGGSDDVPAGDKEIENLINEIVPLLGNDPEATRREEQSRAKLRTIRNILHQPANTVDTLTINDTLRKTYTVNLRTKATITGFYDYRTGNDYKSLDLRLINTLAYYAITFNGETGNITGLNGWDTATVIDKAQQLDCKVTLTVLNGHAQSISTFLANKQAQRKLIDNLLQLLVIRNANGINICFENMPAASASRFTEFVKNLSQALHAKDPGYSLNIIVPAVRDNAYQLAQLNADTDQFLVDFTRYRNNAPGPLAPLQGIYNNDLKTSLSRFMNTDIPPSKLIAYFPYYGVIMKANAQYRFNIFFDYIPFSNIRNKYQLPVQYDKATSTAYIDLTSTDPSKQEADGEITARIWFDDEKTLSLKYDFILQNGLGGIAFRALGYDGDYGEWRDVLTDKFITTDTTFLANISASAAPVAPLDDWQWNWPYIQAKYEQYYFLFAYPCETTYPKVLVRRWQKAGVNNNNRNGIKDEATLVLGIISLVLLVICMGIAAWFIYQIRRLDKWKWKKLFAGILLFLSILLTIVAFMYFFVNTKIAGFGTSDSAEDCFDFPLGYILGLIFTGIVIGIIITRFLIFPLIKKDDIP